MHRYSPQYNNIPAYAVLFWPILRSHYPVSPVCAIGLERSSSRNIPPWSMTAPENFPVSAGMYLSMYNSHSGDNSDVLWDMQFGLRRPLFGSRRGVLPCPLGHPYNTSPPPKNQPKIKTSSYLFWFMVKHNILCMGVHKTTTYSDFSRQALR